MNNILSNMKIRNTILVVVLFFSSMQLILAQENESNFSADLSADFVSRYVWRGINLSSSPAIQPSLSLSYKNLTIGSWASYSFSPETFQEVDLLMTYGTKYFSATINDYYNPVDTLGFAGDYFHVSSSSTRHTLEGMVTLNGPESIPVSLIAGVMLYGNDRDLEGKNLYSTYFELNYTGKIQEIELTPFIGLTPAAGYYGDSFGVVNIGFTALKNLHVSEKFQVPLKGSLIINPQQEKVFFVIGITI
jgi:hypothetical protein